MDIKKMKQTCFILAAALILISFSACAQNTPAESVTTTTAAAATTTKAATTAAAQTTASEQSSDDSLPRLDLTVYIAGSTPTDLAGVKNDVVTPELEKKFNIYVKEVTGWSSQSADELIAQWAAAGNQPDVFYESTGNMIKFINGGIVQPLDGFVPGKLVNHAKYFDQRYWKWWESRDGHIYSIPAPIVNMDLPEYANDPYNILTNKHAMWVREDIAMQVGYSMKPLAQIEKDTVGSDIRPTIQDFAFDPPIKTPDDLYEFLNKIKDLNLTVNGLPVYPINMAGWMTWHFGANFDFGYWQKNDDGSITGLFGSPGAKDYYKFMKRLVDEELIDPDFLVQQGEQLNDKVGSGRVAMGMFIDPPQIEAVKEAIPGSEIRYIEFAKQTPGKGFYDVFTPGFNSVCISNKLTLEEVGRLIEYFDYMFSDEGLDLITWGPESAGIWEMKDGKKVFKDEAVKNDYLNDIQGGMSADYWGLMDPSGRAVAWAKGVAFTPCLQTPPANPFHPMRSYTAQLPFRTFNKNIVGISGADYTYNVSSNGDGGQNCNDAFGYFWGDFNGRDLALLLQSTDDADFEHIWNDVVMKNFEENGHYSAAIADMKVWFDKYQIK